MKRRQERPAPSGSVIVWMAGMVLGAGAGMVLVYHLLLASHAVASTPRHPMAAMAAPVLPMKITTQDEIRREHAQAMQAAMKPKA